ncbi:reverse transcriptase [Phytophthora megakarya]|uniref:Reverse transcriptase n=1 Tax=Phytophthora megakarya TaxID=4795 RepID=A0A225VQR7_9STRA|nr:reverse transcriptase [Phytophthora megakarya]
MSWKRFAKDLNDGRIEQLCILSDWERMTSKAEELIQLFAGSPTESDDTLSGKAKQERFNEQNCKILREHMDVLSDGTPAEEVSRRGSGYCRGIKQGVDTEVDADAGTGAGVDVTVDADTGEDAGVRREALVAK